MERAVAGMVGDTPEPTFREHWVQLLWLAMAKTGRGYRRPSMKRDGRGEDRRKDKLVTTKLQRRLARQSTGRFAVVGALRG